MQLYLNHHEMFLRSHFFLVIEKRETLKAFSSALGQQSPMKKQTYMSLDLKMNTWCLIIVLL